MTHRVRRQACRYRTVHHPVEIPRLRTMARHAVPCLIEATFIPLGLFYLGLWLHGFWGALLVALAWGYTAIARRVLTGTRVPGILVIGSSLMTVRTIVAFASGSRFIYFLQPTLGTVVTASVFLLSVSTDKPLAERLAADFCPLPEGLVNRPGIRRVFTQISILWGLVYVANAVVTFWLLVTQPVAVFVAGKTVVSLMDMIVGVGLSAAWFHWSLRRMGIKVVTARTAPAAGSGTTRLPALAAGPALAPVLVPTLAPALAGAPGA